MVDAIKFPALDEARDKLNAKRKELNDVMQEAGGFDAPDLDKITSVPGDRTAKLEWIRAKNAELNEVGKSVDELGVQYAAMKEAALYQDPANAPKGEPGAPYGGPQEAKGLAQQIVESNAVTGWVKGNREGPQAEIDIDAKALFETTAGWAPESLRSGVVALNPQRPAPTVTNFIPAITSAMQNYVFMRETTFTNAAAERAEGGLYAEATLALAQQSQAHESVAVSLPVTDEQMEDVPGVQGYLESRLNLMIRQRVDLQVLAGDGVSPNLLGTENVGGIQTQSGATGTIPDNLYELFTSIRESGFGEPSVAFIRPSQWQKVILLKDSNGNYIYGHPASAQEARLWGVPIVQTTAVTADKIITGDYVMHSLLSMRRGMTVKVSDSHDDFFLNGKQAIRADLRLAMVHLRPSAFGEVTDLPA